MIAFGPLMGSMKVLFHPSALVVLSVCTLAGCREAPDFTADARACRDKLAGVVRSADGIRLIEHSSQYDLPQGVEDRESPIRIYRSEDLDQEAISSLLEIVRSTPPAPRKWVAACIFEHHHTSEFRKADEVTDRLELCFKCDQIRWGENYLTPPDELLPRLGEYIRSRGFETRRNWRELAAGKVHD